MNETPRPLIVSAIRSFGESGAPAAKEWNTVRNAAWSCPSQVATCQRNAPELLAQVVEGDDLLGRPVRLDLVHVDNHPQVAETLLCCTLERLPVLALPKLPVTRHHHDAAAPAEVALCPPSPRPFEMPMPREPEFASTPGTAMSGWPSKASEPPECEQALRRHQAERVQRRVQPWPRRAPST